MEHDNSYKLLFTHPEMVTDLLKGFINEPWIEQCDFSTLEKMGGSYVTDDIRDREDDIIWRIRYGEEWLYVYLLLEFQSEADHFMAVRIAGYISLLYQDLIRSQKFNSKDLLPPVLPIVLYNGKYRWHAPVQLSHLIQPAPLGLEKYKPQASYFLLDEGNFKQEELTKINNLVAALFQLENSRTEFEIQDVLAHLIVWLKDPAQSSLRRTFTVWINRVLLPTKSPSANYPELNDLNEVHTMLAERVKEWVEEWKEAGRQEGQLEARQEGRQEEASKLFLLLLESKFGSVNQQIQNKVSVASIELIESWSKQIFEATTPEDLLNS